MTHRLPAHAILMLSTAAIGAPALAGVISVPGDAASIQAGIDMATPGDEVVVAAGTYFESIDFGGKAITLRSADGADFTTIDALGLDDSVVHMISGEGADSVLDGFTLTGGNAQGAAPDERGGGIFISASSPTIIDCVIAGNNATLGGGMFCFSSAASVTGCRFLGNNAIGNNGGAAYLNTFNATFADCSFENNTAGLDGGAIYVGNPSTLRFNRCSFADNDANRWGGAINADLNAGAILEKCTLQANSADVGGALYVQNGASLAIRDSVMAYNVAPVASGSYTDAGATASFHNATVWGNSSEGVSDADGGGDTVIVNSILWANQTFQTVNTVVAYSCVQGGYAGDGNIDADPLLLDPNGDDFRPSPGSPVIDAGDSTLSVVCNDLSPVDLGENPRFVNGLDLGATGIAAFGLFVDMGAFEQVEIVEADPCPSDVDESGATDFADLLAILANWGPCPE